jgi:hypothetical protein
VQFHSGGRRGGITGDHAQLIRLFRAGVRSEIDTEAEAASGSKADGELALSIYAKGCVRERKLRDLNGI